MYIYIYGITLATAAVVGCSFFDIRPHRPKYVTSYLPPQHSQSRMRTVDVAIIVVVALCSHSAVCAYYFLVRLRMVVRLRSSVTPVGVTAKIDRGGTHTYTQENSNPNLSPLGVATKL